MAISLTISNLGGFSFQISRKYCMLSTAPVTDQRSVMDESLANLRVIHAPNQPCPLKVFDRSQPGSQCTRVRGIMLKHLRVYRSIGDRNEWKAGGYNRNQGGADVRIISGMRGVVHRQNGVIGRCDIGGEVCRQGDQVFCPAATTACWKGTGRLAMTRKGMR